MNDTISRLPVCLGGFVFVCTAAADSNFLTGANDIVVARSTDGDLYSTPFRKQFHAVPKGLSILN